MKRVLYFAPSARSFEACAQGLSLSTVERPGPVRTLHHVESGIDIELHREAPEVLSRISEKYVHLLVLDLRSDAAVEPDPGTLAAGLALLNEVDNPADIELRYGFHRILVLLRGDGEKTDELIAALGARGIGRILREPHGNGGAETFARRVMNEVVTLVQLSRVGRTALAASGGGVTGIFFEVGAIKCLDDCLRPTTGALDMYFGISAGAVVSGILAAGYSIDELMAAIAKREGGRIPPLDLQLFRLGHLNYSDMARRLGAAANIFWHALYGVVWHRSLPSFNDLFLDYSALVGPPFRADVFERALRVLFERHGTSNDFARLSRPLFIGASDQDARRHVVFGAEGNSNVSISRAIQGSLSVNPAFGAVRIDGRYYEDGAVTRTSNFVEAIARGADLVFIIDPFLPYVSRVAGDADRQGILYNIDQDLRTMSYTRFENTRDWVLRKHPNVSTYTFLPSNRVRRLLTLNPMDHRPYLAIWRGAYLSTYERLRRVRHRLRGDLAVHGIELCLDRATEIAERLERAVTPSFEDFYPGGRVVIPTPPLSLARDLGPTGTAAASALRAVRQSVMERNIGLET